MRKSEPTIEDQIRSIHYKYEIPEEKVKSLLDAGHRFLEIDKAALLATVAGISIGEILAMRKTDPWSRIHKKLGLTAEVYEKKYLACRAKRLARFYGIDEARALSLLEEGYPIHWIRLAYLLETHTGAKTEDILAQRTKAEKWKPWADRVLSVSPEDFTKWIAETRNPSLPVKK